MSMKKVGVVGAGNMGAEIALCFAMADIDVVLSDMTQDIADNGKKKQEAVLKRSVAKGKLPEDRVQPILSRVTPTSDNGLMADCDLVIEAVLENIDIKSNVFKQLDAVCKEDCIIASNTSSIAISKLAAAVSPDRAGRFIGIHFNSPASVMKLVEIIAGERTSGETEAAAFELMNVIGKEPVKIKDVAGFGLNRLLQAFALEACRLVEEGVCTKEDVDKICLYGLGHPVGIFKLLDLIGHDVNLAIENILYDAYGDRYKPSPQIEKLVADHNLGKKTGSGFYDYTAKK